MNLSGQLVVITLDERYYALDLAAVDRTVRMVEVTPLPRAPEIVAGVVNVQGRIIPVLNIRRRFRLPERAMAASDQLLIAHTARRTVALAVDAVSGVIDRPEEELIKGAEIVPGLEYVEGVVKFADGMIFIHNLDAFLSLEEEDALAEAMGQGQAADVRDRGPGTGDRGQGTR